MPRGRARKAVTSIELNVHEANLIHKAVTGQIAAISATTNWPDVLPVTKAELLETANGIIDKLETMSYFSKAATPVTDTAETVASDAAATNETVEA